MFSLGRLLNLNRDRRENLEFIPIGQRVISPEKLQARPPINPRVRLTGDKIDNTHIESSFDETTNHFDTLGEVNIEGIGSSRSGNAGWNSRGNFANTLEQKNRIADGGQSSIQNLQADAQLLKSENYNLKVEVATLKQFLKQTPPETRDVVLQNSALKQELIKTQDELESLRRQTENSPSQDSGHKKEIEALKRLYRDSISEKDHEIQFLERKVKELSHQSQPKIPQDLLDKVEFLQNENQSLLRQLEGASAMSDKNHGQYQSENNELKLELHRLKAKLSDLPSDANEQLDNLRRTNEALQQKLDSISNDLQQAENERDYARSSLKNAYAAVDEKQTQLDLLARSNEDSVSSKSRTLRDAESKLDRAQHEIDDLKLKLKRSEAQLTLTMEEKSSDTQRLQRKVESLQEDLKEKDRDEYALRAQLRSLMEERNKAFDNQSTVQHYQAQIDALREKEKTLFSENMDLKEEIAKLQDELYSRNVDSSRVSKLKQENMDLVDRLEFYEKEYGLTQDALEAVESEVEAMKTEQKRNDTHRHKLETELETLRTQLRRTELSESRKYNESAYMELEDKHRRREEAEHRRMTLQTEMLNLKIRELEQQLADAKRAKETFPSASTYQPVQDSRLKIDLQNKDFELQEKQRDCLKLQSILKDKEDLIDALEERIRKLNKDFRTDFTAEDRYRENLQKLKVEHETQILSILLERDRLQNELKHYKTRLENMIEDDDTQAPNSANSVTIALLEAQLEELRRKNSSLLEELERTSIKRFDHTNREVDEYRLKLKELRFALDDAQQEKSELETTRDTLESDLALLRSEKNRFETKNKGLLQELAKNARNCTRLANKVQDLESQMANLLKNSEDVYRTQRINSQLQNQVDQLSTRLATANLNPQPNQTLSVAKNRLQDNELKYFKAKLFELQTRYMDLALINSFMVSSIRNSYQSCKDDLVKMAQCGIYPDYSALKQKNKKITFKVLATFVLGMVRIKRRTEKAKVREGKLMNLRSDIERDKITLLVEK